MKPTAARRASGSFSVPRQRNAQGTSVLYALKPHGLGTAFVESLTSYLRRLGLEHARRPSFLITELIREPYTAQTGAKFHASLTLTEALNGNIEMTTVFLAYLESLTWVPEVRRTAFGDRVPGLYLMRSACVVRQWCPQCLHDDGAAPYDRLAWSLKAYQACVVHQRELTGICGQCRQSHVAFKKGALPDRCPCGALLADTKTPEREPAENERAIADLVTRLERDENVSVAQVLGGVQAFVQRSGSLGKATAAMKRQHATLGNVLVRRTAMSLESLMRAISASGETLDEFLAHPYRADWLVKLTPARSPGQDQGFKGRSLLYLAPRLRAELKRPDAKVRTLGRFADDYGVGWAALRRQLPELTQALVDRGLDIRHCRRVAREAAEAEEARAAVRAYFKERGTVSLYGVSLRLSRPALMQARHVRDAAIGERGRLLGVTRHSSAPGNTKKSITPTTSSTNSKPTKIAPTKAMKNKEGQAA